MTTAGALILIGWWAVLIFAWSLCRSAALGDQFSRRRGTGSFDPRGPVQPEDNPKETQ